jgi:hypothetical protein
MLCNLNPSAGEGPGNPVTTALWLLLPQGLLDARVRGHDTQG